VSVNKDLVGRASIDGDEPHVASVDHGYRNDRRLGISKTAVEELALETMASGRRSG
jgi:hypothetical protein